MTLLDGDRLKRIDAVAAPAAAFIARAAAARPGRPTARPLIVRPGGMGDLILAHLALEQVGVDPASVDWIIEKRSEPWASHMALPSVSYDRTPRDILERAGRASLVVNTEQRFGLSQALARGLTARGGRLVGFRTSRAAGAASELVDYDWDREHETVAFARLFAVAFGRPGPALGASPADRPRHTPASRALVVALGGRHAPSRTYSAAEWAGHIERFGNAGSEPMRLVGGPGEHELAVELQEMLGGRAVYEKLGFSEVCDAIREAERVLTIDGGLVHVASYYGVPTTVLFTSGRDAKWAPIGAGSSIVARRDIPCRPCTIYGQVPPCPFAYRCRVLEHAEPVAAR